MEKEGKKYILKIKGKEVTVKEEVYREYIRPIQAEQRQKRREWKCKILSGVSESGTRHYVRCNKSCENCPYYLSGKNALGNTFSLDKLVEEGVGVRALEKEVETEYIEKETIEEEHKVLHEAIKKLTLRQQELVRKIYFESKTQEELAKHYGVDKSAISHAMQRIYASLKKYLQKK